MIKSAIATTLLSLALLGLLFSASYAHEQHSDFSAGEPGDPNRPARTIKIAMREAGKKLMFDPAVITVRKGEQIRFELYNEGTESHEFVLATAAENRKHAQLMKKFLQMVHDDPNAKRLDAFVEGQLLWDFTKVGEFEFACLIPGHYEAGMHGKLIVLP